MEKKHFITSVQRLTVHRNIFFIFSLISMLAVLLLGILLFFKSERIVIVPTTGSSFWVEDHRTSDGYLEKMGIFLSDLLLNRNPSDVDRKNQIILEHAHPEFYHEIQRQLRQDMESILKEGKTFVFRQERSYLDPHHKAFITEGEFLLIIGKTGETPSCVQKEKKKYTLGFACQNGRLLLTSLTRQEI